MSQRDFLTIVSGLPRSGTSMMMRMLDKGGMAVIVDNIRKADEDNPLGYYEFEPVKKTKEDASWLAGSAGKGVKMVYRLMYDLPAAQRYRVLFMRRNIDEVLKSQEIMLERKGKGGGGMSDEQFKKMFLAEIDKCLSWMRDQPNFQFIEVDYNVMLSQALPQIAAINRFLGGGLDEQAMADVIDPGLWRNRAK
jgi:hypothetical protein